DGRARALPRRRRREREALLEPLRVVDVPLRDRSLPNRDAVSIDVDDSGRHLLYGPGAADRDERELERPRIPGGHARNDLKPSRPETRPEVVRRVGRRPDPARPREKAILGIADLAADALEPRRGDGPAVLAGGGPVVAGARNAADGGAAHPPHQ